MLQITGARPRASAGSKLRVNPSIDVNESTAYVLAAKRSGGRSGVVLWGGGSPKNFMLQTEPQIQEVLRIKEYGQDFFIQVTGRQGGAVVRLLPQTDPEKTDGVKRALAAVAAWIQGLAPDGCAYGSTNLGDFLE